MGNKTILVAVLNWGLGHATRCIPIIHELKKCHYLPVIASDGQALELLKKEFPDAIFETLPSYRIRYAKKGGWLKWILLLQTPTILKTIKAERKLTEELYRKYRFTGIISDNRWGVRSKAIKKNVFITHQLNVLSGYTSKISSSIQQYYIRKFDECWVPDSAGKDNLSGHLGHLTITPVNVKYIGPLSRFKNQENPVKYEYLILLSGPEPQRSMLESIILKEFKNVTSKTLLIRGVFSDDEIEVENSSLEIFNNLIGTSLQSAMNSSKYIITRSGYTSIMDLAKLGKRAFFIPTPGQEEQIYLAKRMEQLGFAPYCEQHIFCRAQLKKTENYSGLGNFRQGALLRDRFTFFQSE